MWPTCLLAEGGCKGEALGRRPVIDITKVKARDDEGLEAVKPKLEELISIYKVNLAVRKETP